ncbi:MAG: polyphosphate kinase 2 family protein, partial [Candidatus Acidiferrales bacterium]
HNGSERDGARAIMDFRKEFAVKPGTNVKLSKYDPDETFGHHKGPKLDEKMTKYLSKLDSLQYLMYAERKHALLVVFQAMDAGGKDGTIRHVMSGLNPQGCAVTSFKQPSAEELAHDFLWRIHKAMPQIGDIGIFNRSHYEDVLVARVHNLVPKEVWSARYGEINAFEELMCENRLTIVKFFLHISKEEQKKRFMERIDDVDKRWKISAADFAERKYWDDYVNAYEHAISRCSTSVAPWYIIPANKKWFRNLAVSRILVETLESFNMKIPKATVDIRDLKWK